ncbi:unnamed protein product [Rotaria socialis]|uniref:Ion transport domain-containing protein n=1 Tax=Rotaria socialis TaxID=392032 RepID=A0A818EDU8_9BILA|nr:unnamed protein product [Rotaria socialis]CAF3375248.1 unnamed protein product [Rotaria socialis]CAF3457222.1 unnamed protein product [Rotaria socialis]
MNYKSIVFREFTQESFRRIQRYRQEDAERIAAKRSEHQTTREDNNNKNHCTNKPSNDKHIDHKRMPNKELAVGQTLPRLLQNKFPAELIGKPIEEIDSYYRAEYIFVVINRNNTIFRFSATSACFVFSPFNCFRRLAIRILTHSLFSALVMITILSNCVFMTLRNAPEATEYVFTIIYSLEALTKCIARGFILQEYTFLRDPWNWLDFIVITLAYITFFVNLGKVAVLRTFRVLRALKTVAVIPGLKTIVNALVQSFFSLRDVSVLSSFILSIFALIGLQLYMGALRQKCVPTYESFLNSSNFSSVGFNRSYEFYVKEMYIETYWYQKNEVYVLCGNATGSVKCPYGYVCWKDRGMNPNFGYTSFDNYGWAMLSCFRLMTQDYWENLYLLVLSASGRYHFLYFLAIIFFGSFYLINLILAIVSMSYLGQQTLVEAENEERERRKIQDDIDLENEEVQKALEAHVLLHAETALGGEDANCRISYSGISIECEQNETKHESNSIGSLQASPSLFQFDRSSLTVPYVTANGATRIPFFDETQQNSPNEDRKSQQTNSISCFPEINQNDGDLSITLYQDKPPMVCAPMNKLLAVPEFDRISVRSKSELFYDIFHKTFMGSSLYVLVNMCIRSKFEKVIVSVGEWYRTSDYKLGTDS